MTIGLPDAYASPRHLPFNTASLNGQFQLAPPDRDPGTPGSWLLLQGSRVFVVTSALGVSLPDGSSPLPGGETAPLYIGRWQGRPCRMLHLPRECPPPADLQSESLLAADPQLPLPLLSLAGIGRMILHWEETSRHCGHCGAPLQRLPGDWGKACPTCNNHHYPRLHPCVIGLVVRGEELLLVRKPEWADGRYGLVAGFVEFGECLEEAMAREILEETNLVVGNIRYLGSQCWPFPSQLMTGFVTDYVSGEICLQDDELEKAAWFTRDRLPTLPPQRSIARYLIDAAGAYLQR